MAIYPEDLDHPLSRGELSLLGIGWREAAGPLWRSPYRGVHLWSATDTGLPLQRALDAAGLVPPDGALGGWAAAQIGGVSELDGRIGDELLPVLLCLPPHLRRRRGPGVRPLRSPIDPDDVIDLAGVRVTVPVRTAFDLARTGPLLQGVTALDVLGRGRPEFLEAVRGYAEARPRWLGVPRVRVALRLATPMARSPRETAFRLFWLQDCHLPAPEVNATVRSGDGHLLGLGDLLDPVTGLLGEYDGAGHRAETQHALDNAREEDFEDAGLTVVRVSNPDLGRFRSRTRLRLVSGWRRAQRTPRGSWAWEPGPLPPPVPHW
jgi:hypothetical protein